eukprot:311484_1
MRLLGLNTLTTMVPSWTCEVAWHYFVLDNYGSFTDRAIFYSKLRGDIIKYFTTPFDTLGSLCIFTHICYVMVLLLLLFLLFHGRREALWARVGYHVCNSSNVIIHYYWDSSYLIWF